MMHLFEPKHQKLKQMHHLVLYLAVFKKTTCGYPSCTGLNYWFYANCIVLYILDIVYLGEKHTELLWYSCPLGEETVELQDT